MPNFGFAFNNPHFSDRLLQFELLPSSNVAETEAASGGIELLDSDKEEREEMQQLHVNSVILAAHSDYFMRLFSNGMSESRSDVAVARVTKEERQGLHNLIEYMYTGHLREPSNAETAIMLLCLADRFAISSCMEPLVNIFRMFPSTISDCLLVLGLPETLKSNTNVQPIVEHCRCYLSQQFPDVAARKSEFLSLSLEGVKVVLDSESLSVQYEEEVFYYVLDWIESNCHDMESQVQAAEEILPVVRFPWTTGDFLEDVVANNNILIQSQACQALMMEAIKFKSFTHARQQQMMWKKTSHNRFRPRNNLILENFWGDSKTYVLHHHRATSCQVYFEFPLELVICTGDNFLSRNFSLGKYTFYIEARPVPVKASYNSQLTCCILLMLAPSSHTNISNSNNNKTASPSASSSSPSPSSPSYLHYTIAMKRDYSQNYETMANDHCDLRCAEVSGACVQFNDFFSGWFIERGFSYPRWNLTINGPVFFRLDLELKDTP